VTDREQRISEFSAYQPVYRSSWVVEFRRIADAAHLRRRKNSLQCKVHGGQTTGGSTGLPADHPTGFSWSLGLPSRIPQRQGVPRAGTACVFRSRRGPPFGDALSRGATSYLEVLTNETNYFNAELGLAQAQLNELLGLVRIYRNLGGGWQEQ